MAYCDLVLWFFIYSAFGWSYETVFCSIQAGEFVNRGFLFGPYLPIYGFGALFVIAVLHNKKNIVNLFVTSLVLTTALEYVTSWFLELVFKRKWWDYSNYTLQLNGRICLLASLLFGFLGVALIRWIHPHLKAFTHRLSQKVRIVIASLLTIGGSVDLIYSLIGHCNR